MLVAQMKYLFSFPVFACDEYEVPTGAFMICVQLSVPSWSCGRRWG